MDNTAGARRLGALQHPEADPRHKTRLRMPSAGGAHDWIKLSDNSWRPVESGTFPLAPTSPGRVGLLRGYGNALDSETATEFVAAYMAAAGINSRFLAERAAA
jgi:hypothetical protein